MIHANEETETVVKDKIKVAIIDSGIVIRMIFKLLNEKILFRMKIKFLFYMKMEAVMERVLPELLLQKIIRWVLQELTRM